MLKQIFNTEEIVIDTLEADVSNLAKNGLLEDGKGDDK